MKPLSFIPSLVGIFGGLLCASVYAELPGTPIPAAAAASSENGYTLTSEEALARVTRQFTDHYRVQGELSLELIRPWTAPERSAVPIELNIVEFPATLASSLIAKIELQSGGHSIGEYTIAVRCQLYREVWVVRGPLEVGATFDAAQLDTRRVDVLRDRDVVPVTEGDANFTYARTVPVGRLLSWRDLSHRALIHKGQVVEVSAVDGPLVITMKALAMENGAAGETIKVRNLESKKEFPVTVVAEARGLVRF